MLFKYSLMANGVNNYEINVLNKEIISVQASNGNIRFIF